MPATQTNTRIERAAQLHEFLAQWNCGDSLHRHPLVRRLHYTEGVYHMAEIAQAHWLVDVVASYQIDPRVTRDEMLRDFQLWLLKVDLEKHTAVVQLWRDTPREGQKPVIEQVIEYSDFPIADLKLYVRDGVLLLPCEN